MGVPVVRGRAWGGRVGAAPVFARHLPRWCVRCRSKPTTTPALRDSVVLVQRATERSDVALLCESFFPNSTDFSGNLEFLILATGGGGSFTRRLRAAAASGGRGCRAWIDGPYGELGLRPAEYKILVLIAGGIGVTPLVRAKSTHNSGAAVLSHNTSCALCSCADNNVSTNPQASIASERMGAGGAGVFVWASRDPAAFSAYFPDLLSVRLHVSPPVVLLQCALGMRTRRR